MAGKREPDPHLLTRTISEDGILLCRSFTAKALKAKINAAVREQHGPEDQMIPARA
jgi:hypothetical protein